MKSKTPLALIEIMVMLLIFSMTAALCLQAFLWSRQTSEDVLLQDEAVLLAQNTAEKIKHCRGDFAGEAWEEAAAAESENCVVQVTLLDGQTAGLGCASVAIKDRKGNLLYTLPVSWQEDMSGGEAS